MAAEGVCGARADWLAPDRPELSAAACLIRAWSAYCRAAFDGNDWFSMVSPEFPARDRPSCRLESLCFSASGTTIAEPLQPLSRCLGLAEIAYPGESAVR